MRTQGRVRATPALVFYLASGFWLLASSAPALAAPSPEDVFRSVSDNVSQRTDGGRATAILLCAAGGLILLLLLGTRARRQKAAPQPLNHSRKLMREVMRSVPLRRAELKQLRLLAEAPGAVGASDGAVIGSPVQSPLTLLICPSVLARALNSRPPKVDRAVIARIVRKMDLASHAREAQ